MAPATVETVLDTYCAEPRKAAAEKRSVFFDSTLQPLLLGSSQLFNGRGVDFGFRTTVARYEAIPAGVIDRDQHSHTAETRRADVVLVDYEADFLAFIVHRHLRE
jgi:hypothetical protein